MRRDPETCECAYPDCGIEKCSKGFTLNTSDCLCEANLVSCIESMCQDYPLFDRNPFTCECEPNYQDGWDLKDLV